MKALLILWTASYCTLGFIIARQKLTDVGPDPGNLACVGIFVSVFAVLGIAFLFQSLKYNEIFILLPASMHAGWAGLSVTAFGMTGPGVLLMAIGAFGLLLFYWLQKGVQFRVEDLTEEGPRLCLLAVTYGSGAGFLAPMFFVMLGAE